MTVAYLLLAVGVIFLLMGAFYLSLHYIFAHKKDWIGKTMGSRISVKRKKNVEIWEPSRTGGHTWHYAGLIKDWRRGTYRYTVNRKTYRTRLTVYEHPEGLPSVTTVVYFKRIPKIAHVKIGASEPHFDIRALGWLAIGTLFVMTALMAIL